MKQPKIKLKYVKNY